MFECWHFEPCASIRFVQGHYPSFCPSCPLSLGKQPRGTSFGRLVPNLPRADFIKHALSVQCTCAADTSSVLSRASTSTGVLRACVFIACRTFCKLQQRV